MRPPLIGESSRYNVKFTDPKVCKSFLLGCCPHEILASTVSVFWKLEISFLKPFFWEKQLFGCIACTSCARNLLTDLALQMYAAVWFWISHFLSYTFICGTKISGVISRDKGEPGDVTFNWYFYVFAWCSDCIMGLQITQRFLSTTTPQVAVSKTMAVVRCQPPLYLLRTIQQLL